VALDEVMEFIHVAPADERGSTLLFQMTNRESDPKKQTELFRRIIELFPKTPAADMAAGGIQRVNGIGKPFDLTFTDAISGKQISVLKDLKGKIVVVDFWATWCPDCVIALPHEKELYARYKDQGVEFIGVSLDEPESQGGLKALRDFVAQNEVTWPQYYQGNAEQSAFSTSWGIEQTPTMFVVGPDGNLS
jgi:thiol-disulfide isomerase/thioredoxin